MSVSKHLLLLANLLFCVFAYAQSPSGITGIRDTSFTTNSEFNKLKKNYPFIKIAEEFHSPSIKEKKNIVYCSIGNRKLVLDAFYPSSPLKEKRKAILIIYGGGWRSGNRTQHYPLGQRLADLGYVCFTPEYRLSIEALYPASVYDLKAVLRWMHLHANEYNIDTTKITALGFSAGGELAALLGTTINNPSFENKNCNQNASSNIGALVDIDGTLSFVHPE